MLDSGIVMNPLFPRAIRRRLVEQGRLPASALAFSISIIGHAWRLGALAAVGIMLSAGVAFVAG